MDSNSTYVIQAAEKSHCPKCFKTVDLLCHRDGSISTRYPWFYICWSCKLIAQVGRSEVPRES